MSRRGGVSRRELLKRAGVAGTAILALPDLGRVLPGTADVVAQTRTLTAGAFATLLAVCARLIPTDERGRAEHAWQHGTLDPRLRRHAHGQEPGDERRERVGLLTRGAESRHSRRERHGNDRRPQSDADSASARLANSQAPCAAVEHDRQVVEIESSLSAALIRAFRCPRPMAKCTVETLGRPNWVRTHIRQED